MASRKPHILIFNPDQWRGDVLGHMGNPAASTPVLDGLTRRGAVSFRNAFCQNPVCTPSRCSFMTGWYPHVFGHRTMHHMLHSSRDEKTLLQVLRENGYFVWWAGKNDLVPAQHGFAGHCDVHFSPSEEDFRRWKLDQRPGLHGWTEWRGPPEGDNYYSFHAGRLDKKHDPWYGDFDWAMVLGTIDFIKSAGRDKPLCLYLPLVYPHPPYGVEEPFFSAIDRSKLPRRIPAPVDWQGKPVILKSIWERQKLQTWTEDRWTELRAAYYGMCARVDHQFGMVLEALRDAGIYDDTAIFFFADHGDFTGDYGLVEKTQNTFEDCLTRVPLVVKPPVGVSVWPRVSDAMAELIDVPATIYALTGIDPGYDQFGKSLLPVVAGETEQHRDAVFCEGGRRNGETQSMERESTSHTNPEGLYWPRVGLQTSDAKPWHGKATMCRTRTHKHVKRLYEDDEFYDLTKDPSEQHNVSGKPEYAQTLAKMRERMLRWYQETCDIVPRSTDRR